MKKVPTRRRAAAKRGIENKVASRVRKRKGAEYRGTGYDAILVKHGIFLSESITGITEWSEDLCGELVGKEQQYPQDTLFDDDVFGKTCAMINGRNISKFAQDISRLLVPSAEGLAICGCDSLKILVEGVNQGWNKAIPFTTTRPQPNYAVGFGRDAFTQDQLDRIQPKTSSSWLYDPSYYTATHLMFFPFFTCEVKPDTGTFAIPDRRNGQSSAIAVRAVVELFRQVGREGELHRELLAFSISYSRREMNIYGHYAEIDGPKTTYHRHHIRTFDFIESNGKEKWTTYRFTKNVYEHWMPPHLTKIRSAIDQLPLIRIPSRY